MSNPFFSIIVPVYNVANYLEKTVKSIQNQNFSDYECIVVDDGSTDGSSELCETFSQVNSRIKVIHKKNEGVAVARNVGIEKACGKYILFLDGDDTLEQNSFHNIFSELEKSNSDILIYGYKRVTENGEIIKKSVPELHYSKEKMYKNASDLTFLLWNKTYKKELFKQIDLHAVDGISFSEDSYITLALQNKAKSFSFLNEALYNYLCRKNSVTQKMSIKNHEDRMKAVKLMDSLYFSEKDKPEVLKAIKFDTKFFYIAPRLSYDKNTFFKNCKIWRKTFSESNSQKTAEIGTKKMALYLLLIRLHLDKIAYKFYELKQRRLLDMKIGLYIKDILYATGGTESYTVRMAQALQEIYPEAIIHFVTECYNKKSMPSQNEFVKTLDSKYGTKLSTQGICLDTIFGSNKGKISSSILRKKIENHSKGFDLFFYCSRGHYIFKAKRNIAIIHFPMEKLAIIKGSSNPFRTLSAKAKDKAYYSKYNLFLPNSNFTKTHLKKLWPEIPESKIQLLYPPVLPIPQLNLQKKNQIFVCSRLERDKNLESLMQAYKSSDFLVNNYSLIIAGGSDEGSIYLPELIEHTKGYNIFVLDNKPFSEITKLYNESKFFWHCKGYGVDENKEPYKCEHFGITTVEAMSVGCIPIVINKAGQKEIVQNECGEKWLTLEELTEKTERLAKDEKLQAVYAENAKKRAEEYFLDAFTENLRNILNNL